jgi:protease-4
MRSFFKIFFASFLALVVFAVVGFLILVGIVAAFTSPDKPEVGSKAVLLVDLTKQYKEQSENDPLNVFTGNADDNVPGLYDVVRMIAYAKKDSAVKGIYIKCDDNANGFAASEELRNAIIDFKSSRKFVIAFGDVISQKAYYVANAADKVYCNPKGFIEWKGLSTTLMFLKGTLEKLDIEPQIFYAGKFKSATEPLRAYKMSEPNRLQTTVLLTDLYKRMLIAAAAKSKTDTAQLRTLANAGAIQTATEAVQYRLIDAVKYDDEVKSEIIGLIKGNPTAKINFVSLGKYAKAVDFTPHSDSKMAIIYAEGEIVDGEGTEEQIQKSDKKG